MRPAGCGTKPRIASAVIDLPQPDSPTMLKVSPRFTVNETRSNTRTGPARVANSTTKSRACNRGDSTVDGDSDAVGDGDGDVGDGDGDGDDAGDGDGEEVGDGDIDGDGDSVGDGDVAAVFIARATSG